VRRHYAYIMRKTLAAEPLAEMQYVSCADYNTLEELGNRQRESPAFDGRLCWQDALDR
jgi:hypothetical protein